MVQKKKIVEARKNQENSIVKEITNAVNQLNDALSRLENLKEIMQNAVKSYDLALVRFQNQEISSQDILLARERRFSAENRYLNSFINYKMAIVNLRRRTLWDFVDNKKAYSETDVNSIIGKKVD